MYANHSGDSVFIVSTIREMVTLTNLLKGSHHFIHC
jgi:hypothetical protein